ncbi:MAG: hypothetical protein F9K48_11430 [Candidatus Brocadia sp.]|nr:MAG: hypothetical protein F9K48_11430 [Candidatus Brocadia sp.]
MREKRDDGWTNISSPDLFREQKFRGVFGDTKARVIQLERIQKTVCGCCGKVYRSSYDKKVRRIRDLSCGNARRYMEVAVSLRLWSRRGQAMISYACISND